MIDTQRVFKKFFIKYKNNNNLSVDLFLVVIGVFFATILIMAPQIYIKNNIYYKSRQINNLYIKYEALLAQNRMLKRQLETLYLKHTMFSDSLLRQQKKR